MSAPLYKVGNPIKVVYQANNAGTGKTVAMDVYDETQTLDSGQSVAAMSEIGSVGRYRETFTPDAEGDWIVLMSDGTGKGKVVTHYEVIGHDLDSVGDAIDALGSPAMVG